MKQKVRGAFQTTSPSTVCNVRKSFENKCLKKSSDCAFNQMDIISNIYFNFNFQLVTIKVNSFPSFTKFVVWRKMNENFKELRITPILQNIDLYKTQKCY